jgi:uncharacterized protein DUF5667
MKVNREESAFASLLEGMTEEAPAEVAKLAALARALEHARPVTGVAPAPAFRNSLRNRLVAEAAVRRPWLERTLERWTERNAGYRRSFKFVFANAVAAVVLLAGGSMFAVADTAVPGDGLYFAKRMHENARLLVTRSAEPRGYLQLELSRERLEELRELVSRGERNAAPYFTALNDMDARTLDATRLLVQVYGKTRNRLPLDRLTQFAVAQRLGLEVLLERMPPTVRPPARDSIDILTRVTDRVTGIVGGCLCPANPLVPGTSPPAGPTGEVGSSSNTPQGPLCPCGRIRGDNPPRGPNGAVPPPSDEPPPEEPPADPRIDVNLPDIPGTNVDNTVNGIIDEVLEEIDDLLDELLPSIPTPAVTLPPLPL